MSPAYITGLGLITPLGHGVEQTWRALLAGEFIRDHSKVTGEFLRDTGFQPVPVSLEQAKSPYHSRVSKLGCIAAQEAIAQARWSRETLSDPETCVVVGTSKGPIESWLSSSSVVAAVSAASSRYGAAETAAATEDQFGLAGLVQDIACEIGLGTGYRTTLSAACASGLHALIHATMLLRAGTARSAIVVAAEASVHPMFISSFKRLGVLAAEGAGCRPFDMNRTGFLMSEAAAAVCLEIDETSRTIAAIDRFALGADAFHLTGGDPQGKVMRRLLSDVIAARPVDLIHAHATGTKLHDPMELAAIESAVINPATPIYSHKGALGHSLGAAGLVAVVLNCMSHQTGTVPPNVQTQHALKTSLRINRDSTQQPVRRSLALAAGFGGAMGVVSLVSQSSM